VSAVGPVAVDVDQRPLVEVLSLGAGPGRGELSGSFGQGGGDLLGAADADAQGDAVAGGDGHAVLDNLLPGRRRQRAKARTCKNPTSKYSKNSLQHPATAQHYTLEAEVAVMDEGLKTRSRR
jgi:hypothetical protein